MCTVAAVAIMDRMKNIHYNWTAYEIITNELALILPTISKQVKTEERYHYIS